MHKSIKFGDSGWGNVSKRGWTYRSTEQIIKIVC
jgi:hypothetical protein